MKTCSSWKYIGNHNKYTQVLRYEGMCLRTPIGYWTDPEHTTPSHSHPNLEVKLALAITATPALAVFLFLLLIVIATIAPPALAFLT